MRNWLYLVLVFCTTASYAQRFELGLHGGVCNYYGDISPSVKLNETNATGGLFARLNLNHTFALRAEFNRFTITGSDKNFEFNKIRNLSFKTNIHEAAMIMEFNFLKYGPHVLHEEFTSFVYLGVAAFNFNPQANLDGKWYDLSDYKTENVAYSKLGVAIPFGIGLKYMASDKFAFECQMGFRKTYTDYLDDVSTVYPDVQTRFTDGGIIGATLTDRSIETYGDPQFKMGNKRGDPAQKDWYMNFTVGVSMRLNTRSKCARFF
jgi:hypothetical protein